MTATGAAESISVPPFLNRDSGADGGPCNPVDFIRVNDQVRSAVRSE